MYATLGVHHQFIGRERLALRAFHYRMPSSSDPQDRLLGKGGTQIAISQGHLSECGSHVQAR